MIIIITAPLLRHNFTVYRWPSFPQLESHGELMFLSHELAHWLLIFVESNKREIFQTLFMHVSLWNSSATTIPWLNFSFGIHILLVIHIPIAQIMFWLYNFTHCNFKYYCRRRIMCVRHAWSVLCGQLEELANMTCRYHSRDGIFRSFKNVRVMFIGQSYLKLTRMRSNIHRVMADAMQSSFTS